MDTTTIIAGLLHDTLEDTDATLEDITLIFGQELGSLVNGLTKLKDIKYLTRKEKQVSNFMKMLLSVIKLDLFAEQYLKERPCNLIVWF